MVIRAARKITSNDQALYGGIIIVGVLTVGVSVIFNTAGTTIVLLLCVIACTEVLKLLQGTKAAMGTDQVAKDAVVAAQLVAIVAERVDQVRETATKTDGQLADLSRVTAENNRVIKSTHFLVNHSTTLNLAKIAELSQWKAEREPTESNNLEAILDQQALEKHIDQQKRADAASPPSGFGEMPSEANQIAQPPN